MIEAPTTNRTRYAIRAAHEARGAAVADLLRWLRKPFPSE